MSPVGLTLTFPAQHFHATPTDGLLQLIIVGPCMFGSHTIMPTTIASASTSNASKLNLLHLRICIKDTVSTERDKCTDIQITSVTFL